MDLTLTNQYQSMGISPEVVEKGKQVENALKERFFTIDQIAEYNQIKVIRAMQKYQVSDAHFGTSTGYGYDDIGRDTLEKVYADIFSCEDALVRPQITCGTHALAVALFGILRPGDLVVSASGKPYDTLEEVIGIRKSPGSLAEFGVRYDEAPLKEDGSFDFNAIREKLSGKPKMVMLQRSRGYLTRPSFTVEELGEVIAFIKSVDPETIIMVDNCYGEFVETIEPTDVGADIMVGSLIKNPGGGLAPIGGYVAGKKALVDLCAFRLTSPGIGREVGANLGVMPSFYQGLFLAPTVVASAVKGAIFAARLFEEDGYQVFPVFAKERADIVQAITFGCPEGVIAFCKGIQAAAPVDSFADPEPGPMPGYDSPVIMAAGAFVSGSSIELSADGPLRAPYTVYFQGGLTWFHAKLGILKAYQEVKKAGVVPHA